jgi:hypothetical protein
MIKITLLTFISIFLLSSCIQHTPEAKCTTKPISYQEFKDFQKNQKSNANTVWKANK